MNRGLVNLAEYQEEMQERIENDDYTFAGTQGCCFVDGQRVIKLYKHGITERSDLSQYRSKHIAFPMFYIEKNDSIIGEVMPYIKALTLEKVLNGDSNIDKLLKYFMVLEKEVKNFPYLEMRDLWYQNVLYGENKGMYIIDTTSWIDDGSNKINHNDSNLYYLNRALFEVMRSLVVDEHFCCMDLLSPHMNKTEIDFIKLLEMSIYHLEYHFMDLMMVFNELVKIRYNGEVNTVSDVKKYMKMMKKS